ncbi:MULTISPECIES: carbohydrate ABC transporter permease [Paenibacillus]|uniref:ABC transporter permease n=1 Tax=Paenibacillus helianthi TaxID=1349432 RepID=A0ABX3ELC3_9BACL|nr:MULTISPECIES: carbohydrate ABC transporter permease [Paenibacillus]OKP68282.1 ABC transporter permease [Paenibacillus sp. P3E]OKP83943.1 ABC transporter permease [Paenibacillus helianthi]OKP89398.1 ABC transporter permease [Paenibacillus sp. P32E]OKP97704.1 ABC transporter permease [Paenibacillus sp. P46E]
MLASRGEKVFVGVITGLLILLSVVALVPLVSVISTSLSSKSAVDMNLVTLWPKQFTLDSWKYIVDRPDLWKSFFLTLSTTVIGTVLALLMTALFAYPLSKPEFRWGSVIMMAVVVAMIFKAPIIPYFLTVRGIGLYDNPLVLVIPHILNPFNLIIMRTFFKQFSKELEEAAFLEGCGYFRMLFQFVLPLSKAVLATLALFYGVVLWNQFQHPLLFLQDTNWFPLQIKIRQFITDDSVIMAGASSTMSLNYNERTLRAATVIFAIVPIVVVYPFLQKYFVKGAMIGSVKG